MRNSSSICSCDSRPFTSGFSSTSFRAFKDLPPPFVASLTIGSDGGGAPVAGEWGVLGFAVLFCATEKGIAAIGRRSAAHFFRDCGRGEPATTTILIDDIRH